MEKVILTQEQAEAIEYMRKKDDFYTDDSFLDAHAKNKQIIGLESDDIGEEWGGQYCSLNDLSVSKLSRVLHIGYEIEPEKPKFQPGDKVLYQAEYGEAKIFTLIEESNYQGDWKVEKSNGCILGERFRHATPAEIKWYETLGRKSIGDFHYGDVAVGLDEDMYLVGMGEISIQDAKDMHKKGLFKGIYPIGSYSRLPKEEMK